MNPQERANAAIRRATEEFDHVLNRPSFLGDISEAEAEKRRIMVENARAEVGRARSWSVRLPFGVRLQLSRSPR